MTDAPKAGELMFVYGSLRKGHYNHGGIRRMKFIGEGILSGYKLYSLGSYPAIFPSENNSDKVIGEIYQITPDTEHEALSIHYMELGAGYRGEIVSIQLGDKEEDKECLAYVYDHSLSEDILVPSGDWNIHTS